MRSIPASIVSLIAVAAAAVADAHPAPRAASPAPNAVLTSSPPEIRITFNEGLVRDFCGIDLKDAAGKSVAIGPAAVDSKDNKTLVARVKARLGPGTYTVNWRAVGDDTHHVAGHYAFQMKP